MAAGITHELRSALRIVAASARVLRRSPSKPVRADQGALYGVIFGRRKPVQSSLLPL